MTTGEAAAIAAIIGSGLAFLGVTGIDSGVINGAVNGVISLITIVSALYAYFAHKQAAVAAGYRR